MRSHYCTNLPVYKGQKVRIKGSNKTYIAETDIISNPVLILGDRAIGKDSSQLKLNRRNELFKLKTKPEVKPDCKLVASSLLSAIASFNYNPEGIYNYYKWQIESLEPDALPYVSWTFNNNAQQCQAVEDGSGEYEDLASCLAANQQLTPSKTVKTEKNLEFVHLYNVFNFSSYSSTIRYNNSDIWAYKNGVFNSNFFLNTTYQDNPTYNYDPILNLSQTYRLRFIILINPDLNDGEFYRATYRITTNNFNFEYTVSYKSEDYLTGARIVDLTQESVGLTFNSNYTSAIVNEIPANFTINGNFDFNFDDLLGMTIPRGIPVLKQPISFAGGSLNYVWIDNLTKKMPMADYQSLTTAYPPANYNNYSANNIKLVSRKQSDFNYINLLSNIDYKHLVNSGYINYFVKIHNPNLPVINVFRIPESRYYRLFFIFLGNRAFIIVKIGKLREANLPLDQRPWYQVKIIELNITNTELIVNLERNYFYPDPIEIIPGLPLEQAKDIVIKNRLGYLDDPVVPEDHCFNVEKYWAKNNYFLETNFKKGSDGAVYEYKIPGKLVFEAD